MYLNGGKHAGNMQMDIILMFMEKMSSGDCLPRPWAINMYNYDHNIQTSSSLKPLGQSKPNFMWSIVRKRE